MGLEAVLSMFQDMEEYPRGWVGGESRKIRHSTAQISESERMS